jgi:hypothetical protein
LVKWNGLNKLKQTYLPKMKEAPVRVSQKKQEESEESESESESSGDDDSDEDGGVIPKEKLAGKPAVVNKKSRGLKALFK